MTDEQKTAGALEDGIGGVDLEDEVHYPPVENGLDYMVSVVEHLQGDKVGRRNLKYAVVHLQAAVECLLKYRLEAEHWSLVFKNPGEAKRSALDDGSLISCTVEQTITRLTDIAGVAISEREKIKLTQLAKLRNQLQHYGRPHDAKVNRYVIEANAAELLEFLTHFVDKEVLPNIAPPDGEIAESLRLIREGLDTIRGFVTARMRRLAPELASVKPRTVQCPSCYEFALVVGNETEARCLYCHYRDDADAVARRYTEEVLGFTDLDLEWSRGGTDPVEECPACDLLALVCGVHTAADSSTPVDLCFSCGANQSDLPTCPRCGRRYAPLGDDDPLCSDCVFKLPSDASWVSEGG
ncbi:hypothetical protein [Kitasatospora aburaviensis]|uniref:Uncharacterized protein n=1 Tax=Kitasatospora aburaviensis TaxID=67265 RepID=A0ABW1EYL6_9ACTN